jgi:hypothetical protein
MYSFSYNSQIKCFRTHIDMEMVLFLCLYVEFVPEASQHLSVTPGITTPISESTHFNPEYGGLMLLRNISILPQN